VWGIAIEDVKIRTRATEGNIQRVKKVKNGNQKCNALRRVHNARGEQNALT